MEADVLRAEEAGRAAKQLFKERLEKNTSGEGFFDPVKKLKLLTMEAGNKKVKLTSTQGKVRLF